MPSSSPSLHLSKPRLALAMLLPVYPLITLLLYVVMPLTEGWTIWQRTLVIAPVMISSIVFVIAPLVQRHFAGFILTRR